MTATAESEAARLRADAEAESRALIDSARTSAQAHLDEAQARLDALNLERDAVAAYLENLRGILSPDAP